MERNASTDSFELKSITEMGGKGGIVVLHLSPKTLRGLQEHELQDEKMTEPVISRHEKRIRLSPPLGWGGSIPAFS